MSEDILIISNDPETTNFLKEIVSSFGLKYLIKRYIRTGINASKDQQIVVIDCVIADGTWIECLESFISLNSDIIPLVVLDEKDNFLRAKALKKGAFSYLLKPFNKQEIVEVFKRAIQFKNLKNIQLNIKNLTVEDFLREKLSIYFIQFKSSNNISIYDTVLCEIEKALLKIAIEIAKGNKSEASRLLGLNRNTVRNKLKKYKIK